MNYVPLHYTNRKLAYEKMTAENKLAKRISVRHTVNKTNITQPQHDMLMKIGKRQFFTQYNNTLNEIHIIIVAF